MHPVRLCLLFAASLLTLTATEPPAAPPPAAEAAAATAALRAEFDRIVAPAATRAVRQPLTDEGGTIAWGESYLLSALVEMLAVTREPAYAEKIVALADWIDRCRDDRHDRRDEVRGAVLPAWSSTRYSKGRRYTWAVHTGMIAAPLARFAATVRRDPALQPRWARDADRLLRIAEEAVAAHDGDFREGPGPEEGHLYSPYLGKHLPLNMQNALARAWLAIDDATGTAKYRDRATRLAHFLKNRLRLSPQEAYVWSYWPPLTGRDNAAEDISHASINVDFMVLCHERGIVFTRGDLERVRTTLLQHVLLADDRVSDRVDGGGKVNTHRDAVMRWARLGRHLPDVRERLLRFCAAWLPDRANLSRALGLALLSLPPGPATAAETGSAAATWSVGLAESVITPREPLWMGGFASRTKPAEGTLDELRVQALALRAPDGGDAVLVTADLVGVPKWLYDDLCRELARRHGLQRRQIRFAPSHTHSGPVLRDALPDVYPLDAAQREPIRRYSAWLPPVILATVDRALAARAPARLYAGDGTANFAFNRRTNQENKLPEMQRSGVAPNGPSDFAVPVLAVQSPAGAWRAVVFGYAAHTSTLTQNYRWSADYAGAARRALEEKFPDAMALFFQGCGSDQSAVPRGTVERCQKLGEDLAAAVAAVLARPMRPVAPRLRTAFEFVALDFGEMPTPEMLATVGSGTDYRARWARRLAAEQAEGRTFARGYPEYPVQVWRLGTDQLWIALGGEVCVDYALRCKREFGAGTWINGYANDVMAYIPSRRLWEEGGYQAGAFEVYGYAATRWCPDIEDRIFSAIRRLVAAVE
jgi:hypothetical protein